MIAPTKNNLKIFYCERCTGALEIQTENEDPFYLCEDCFLVLGNRPSEDHHICEYCCDRWTDNEFCMMCFLIEPVTNQMVT